MENIRPFQIALLAGFAFLGVLSLILLANFSGFSGSDDNIYGESVEIWGILDDPVFNSVITNISDENEAFEVVTYKQLDPRTFDSEFINALAEGRGPDAIVLPSNMLVSLRSKLVPIPYDTLSLRSFRNSYIDGSEIFAQTDGIYAVPFAVDPLVMYWNRDLFAASNLVEPPNTWEEFVSRTVPALVKKDSSRKITQSAVAFGEYDNVNNAVPVMLALALQAGSDMVVSTDSEYLVKLNMSSDDNVSNPFTTAMQFYLDFSNRNSSRYSWDLSHGEDYTAFLGQRLAVYFGFSSELQNIIDDNPNLNFDVATIPQGSGAVIKRTYGEYYGFALVRAGDNLTGTYNAVQVLASAAVASDLSEGLGMVPVVRSVLSAGSLDSFREVFFAAAVNAYSWLDPSPVESGPIFKEFITDVTSNRSDVSAAAANVVKRLTQVF